MKNYCLNDVYKTLNMKHKIHYKFCSEQTESVSILIY